MTESLNGLARDRCEDRSDASPANGYLAKLASCLWHTKCLPRWMKSASAPGEAASSKATSLLAGVELEPDSDEN